VGDKKEKRHTFASIISVEILNGSGLVEDGESGEKVRHWLNRGSLGPGDPLGGSSSSRGRGLLLLLLLLLLGMSGAGLVGLTRLGLVRLKSCAVEILLGFLKSNKEGNFGAKKEKKEKRELENLECRLHGPAPVQ